MVGVKRTMEYRVSQEFCLLIKRHRYPEALEYGRKHAEFIRNDRWYGSGMVETALYHFCSADRTHILMGDELKQELDRKQDLLMFILYELGGETWINHHRPNCGTPLIVAIDFNSPNTVRMLINCCPELDLNITNPICDNPIYRAAQNDNLDMLSLLLDGEEMLTRLVIDDHHQLAPPNRFQIHDLIYKAKQKIAILYDSTLHRVLNHLPKELVFIIEDFSTHSFPRKSLK